MRWLDGITNSMDMREWTLGVGGGQRGLACCGSWGRKESDTTERLNRTLKWQKMQSKEIKFLLTRKFLGQFSGGFTVTACVKAKETFIS